MTKFQKFFIGIVLVIIGLNLVGLWTVQIVQLKKQTVSDAQKTTQSETSQNPNPDQKNEATQSGAVPANSTGANATLQKLASDLEKLTQRILKLEKNPAPTASTTVINNPSPINFQKQIVYLGTAETNSFTWVDTSVEVKLNSFSYPKDVTATFEAAISIWGGDGFARLKNKTTNTIISGTELTHNTSTATWKTSKKFTLDYNENVYLVQLRSNSGETVKLEGARVIIDR